MNEMNKKFPGWPWIQNIKAWLLYSQPTQTEQSVFECTKILNELLKDKSIGGSVAKMKLGTVLWEHADILKQSKDSAFQLWLEFAKSNPNNSSVFYCIALYLLLEVNIQINY